MTRFERTAFRYTTRDYFDMALCALSLAVVMFAAAMGAYQ